MFGENPSQAFFAKFVSMPKSCHSQLNTPRHPNSLCDSILQSMAVVWAACTYKGRIPCRYWLPDPRSGSRDNCNGVWLGLLSIAICCLHFQRAVHDKFCTSRARVTCTGTSLSVDDFISLRDDAVYTRQSSQTVSVQDSSQSDTAGTGSELTDGRLEIRGN